ncbi:MAG: hypothetical protein AAF449_24730 [Myxococcota bacterium]
MNVLLCHRTIIAGVVLCAFSTACLPRTTVVRERAPIDLSTGKPQNPCERREFLEIVPVTGFAQSQQEGSAGFGWVRIETLEAKQPGFSIYRQRELQLMPEILPRLDEPELTDLHLGRLEPIQAKKDVESTWKWITVAVGSVGIGVSIAGLGAVATDSDAVGPLLGVAGGLTVASLLTALGAFVNRPSNQENTYYDLRQRLLIEGEDDLAAASRGVDRYNQQARERCER